MKIHPRILALRLLITSCILCAEAPFQPYWPRERYQAQSFLFTRPIFENIVAQQALWHSIIYNKQCSRCHGLQITPLYQNACGTHKNKYYWLFDCKTDLLFSGDDNINDLNIRDVRAEWFQLPSSFRGQMTFNPVEHQAGVCIEYHRDLGHCCEIDCLDNCWLSVELPIVYIKNDIGLTQWNMQHEGTVYPSTIAQSFCNPEWKFLKVCGAKHIVQPAFLNLRLGKTYYNKDKFQLLFYLGFSLPTSTSNDGSYMFYPVAGYNGHFGFIAGVHTQILLTRDDSPYSVCFFAALENLFLVPASQYRTFDLLCKPWSRYLLYIKKHSLPQAFVPGVNILTRKVRVHPYTLVDFACGWRVITNHWEFELGYGIWGHGDEKIELKCGAKCPPDNEYGIAGIPPLGYNEAVTASDSTIQNQAPYDHDEQGHPVFVPITESQLDLLSAASRSALNHKIFASIGHVDTGCIEYLYGVGVYIEIPQWRTSLQSWGVWAKFGLVF